MPGIFIDNLLLPPVFQLDAGDTLSYSGAGQTFANMYALPADGSAQTAYDFYRGTTSGADASDPTFNGVAGNKSVNEYFSVNGSQDFTLIGANTTFINNLHKDNAAFSILAFIRTPTAYGGVDHGIVATSSGTLGDEGIILDIRAAGTVGFRQFQNTPSITSKQTVATMTNSTNYMIGVTVDESDTSTGCSLYINSAVENFSGAYSVPSVNSATYKMQIASMANNSFYLGNGGRIYHILMFNRKLPDGQVQGYYQRYRSRYGLP